MWEAFRAERSAGAGPFASAVRVASNTDRLGFAFAVGYSAALECMVPGVRFPAALCVTEEKGNSPRAIETTLDPNGEVFTLSGTKSFVTFGNLASTLIVSARVGVRSDGRPEIAVVRIPADRRGVRLHELPDTPFVPEVPHAAVELDRVVVNADERLPGDGYLGYVKPFRTIEDIHVIGATMAYLLGLSRRVGAPMDAVAGVLADLISLERLASEPPLEPCVHVALHGVHERLSTFARGAELASILQAAEPAERSRWNRDAPLLRVAQKARDARFARAVERLNAGTD